MSTSKTSPRDGPTASTCDDGVCSERRQTVCAETFRMGNTAGRRGALRIRNAAFLTASRDMRTFRVLRSLADILRWLRYVRFTPEAEHRKPSWSVNENILVFDRNYVAFQAYSKHCKLSSLVRFADDYRASGKIFWLPMLTANRLRKVLSYAPATGIFRWKVSASTRAPVGTIAGAKNGRGYHQIRIDGRPYSASRLAWLYMTGKWPSSEISYAQR